MTKEEALRKYLRYKDIPFRDMIVTVEGSYCFNSPRRPEKEFVGVLERYFIAPFVWFGRQENFVFTVLENWFIIKEWWVNGKLLTNEEQKKRLYELCSKNSNL